MRNLTVITCFSYLGNEKYVFNPDYLRSDLRRILAFSLNKIGCSLKNVFVLSDILPAEHVRDEIFIEFQEEVEDHLRDLGYRKPIVRDHDMTPLDWLQKICNEAAHYLRKSPKYLINGIIRDLLPILRSSNVVEFASLFTNFTLINGRSHFDQTLRGIFKQMKSSQSLSTLFFYYTGHGVRHWTSRNGIDTIKDICLVVPARGGAAEFYSQLELRKIFQTLPSRSSSFVVFDCCHAESLLDLPFKISFNKFGQILSEGVSSAQRPEIVYLASTQNDQTCGFYVSSEECGSVFTYYLIQSLETLSQHLHEKYNRSSHRSKGSNDYYPSIRKIVSRDFSYLHSAVEQKIQDYRIFSKKPPQNMLIRLSQNNITELPDWLFGNRSPRLIEQND